MAEFGSHASLPERQVPDDKVEKYRDFYVELLGFVPPRIQARTDLLARLDPELLAMQEQIRQHCMYPKCFDIKSPARAVRYAADEFAGRSQATRAGGLSGGRDI